MRAQIRRDDIERLAIYRRQHDQRLQLACLIKSVAGFRFNGSGAVSRKTVNCTACLGFQIFRSRGADGFHTREDSTARLRDLMIIRATNAHLVIQQPGMAVNQVSVAVHESWHDDSAGGVDLFYVCQVSGEPLHFISGARGFNQFPADKHGAIADEAHIAERGAAPGLHMAAQRQKLSGAPNQQGMTHLCGASLVGARSPAS